MTIWGELTGRLEAQGLGVIFIDLTHLLQEVYEQGCYDLQINYRSVLPDLSPADLDWVKQVIDRCDDSIVLLNSKFDILNFKFPSSRGTIVNSLALL